MALDDTLTAAKEKQRYYIEKKWTFTFGGRFITLKDEAEKIVRWLDRFKAVGDIASNVDPVHVGLPWAGIRLLLEVRPEFLDVSRWRDFSHYIIGRYIGEGPNGGSLSWMRDQLIYGESTQGLYGFPAHLTDNIDANELRDRCDRTICPYSSISSSSDCYLSEIDNLPCVHGLLDH